MNRLARMWVRVACLVVVCVFANMVCAQEETSLRASLEAYVEAGEMPGFVSVLATKDEIVQLDCVGFADIEGNVPMAPDTLFWIASTSKIFTAAAVMTLVDQGKINLDDPIEKYLPQFRNYKVAVPNANGTITLRDPESKPTLRQALCHTAGWVFRTPTQEAYGIDALEVKKMAVEAAMFPMVRDPGEGYQYSQVGIDLAGAVVEQVSGMPFHEYMQVTFFDPLGMKNTTFWPSVEAQKSLAHSYRWNEDTKKLEVTKIGLLSYPLECRRTRFAEPGGGIFSTPEDIVKFFQMLAGKGEFQGKRYLSEDAVHEISQKQTPAGVPNTYGLCAFLGGGWFGHGGAHGNDALVDANRGFVAIYMVQVTGVPKQGAAKSTWMNGANSLFNAMSNPDASEGSASEGENK